MTTSIPAYLEAGVRRVFAGALDWPGWCRAGKDEASALEALVVAGPRYAAALRRAVGSLRGFKAPVGVSVLEVVERLEGNATTDFGAPGIPPKHDQEPLDGAGLKRLSAIQAACWAAFDDSAGAAKGATLSTGPRGGGRELDAIVGHVVEAERAYLRKLGGRYRPAPGEDEMAGLRTLFLETLAARARGEPLPETGKPRKLWTPRYAVRRSAWHALDHAWEIEDRAG